MGLADSVGDCHPTLGRWKIDPTPRKNAVLTSLPLLFSLLFLSPLPSPIQSTLAFRYAAVSNPSIIAIIRAASAIAGSSGVDQDLPEIHRFLSNHPSPTSLHLSLARSLPTINHFSHTTTHTLLCTLCVQQVRLLVAAFVLVMRCTSSANSVLQHQYQQ
jgi:hypothetical protein